MNRKELEMLQALPLDIKVAKSKLRIKEWIDFYGEDGVYVSFSGGKDSTVLLDLVRQVNPNIRGVFVDTGLEYPELKEFVKTFDNIDTIRPSMSFKQVIETYGYPITTKEQANYLHDIRSGSDKMRELRLSGDEKGRFKLSQRWEYLIDAPFDISAECCNVMKKRPIKDYEKRTSRVPFVGTLAEESSLRLQAYLNSGCNSFDSNRPKSTPLGFWTEQDILMYVKENKLKICSVYGDIVEKNGKLVTTGEERTGCIYCGFGAHLQPYPNKYQRLEMTHPKLYKYCMEKLGFKEVCEFMKIPYNNEVKAIVNFKKTNITDTVKLTNVIKKFYEQGVFDNKRVLDYSYNKPYDIKYLIEKGIEAEAYEPFSDYGLREYPTKKYDIITCNYVINMIEDSEKRREILDVLRLLGDEIYVTVRADRKAIKDSWQEYKDGHLTSRGTFQKLYTSKMLKEEFGDSIEILFRDTQGITFKYKPNKGESRE